MCGSMLSVFYLCEYTQRPEEAIGSLEAWVTGGGEPDTGAGNQIWLSHLQK